MAIEFPGLDHHYRLFIETLLALVCALLLGLVVDLVFPKPLPNEPLWKALLLVLAQVLVDALIVFYFIVFAILLLDMFDQDTAYGIVSLCLFVIVFFTVQTQLAVRLSLISEALTLPHNKAMK